jgi:hypothetical protein
VAAVYTDGNGNLQQGPATSVTLSGTRSNTFTFAPSVQNTVSNCPGTTTRDMLGTFTSGTDTTRGSGTINFCSDAYQSGAIVQGGGTATAYFANTASTACAVNATLNTDGLASGAVTATTTVPGNSALLPYTFTFTTNQVLTMNTGDRLNVSIDSSGPGCGSTVLHYAGASTASQFQSGSVTAWAPTTPTTLTVTPQPDGTTVLTWPESSGGAPVSFYRVYRDGHDYVNRYDILATTDCQNGTCTYTDPRRTSSHSYYITAVGSTTPGENLAESPSVGPVSG